MTAEAVEVPVIEEGVGTIVLDTEVKPEVPNVPSAVPEKFKNPDGSLNQDALLKSYTELEKMKPNTPETPAPIKEDTGESLSVPDPAEVIKAVGESLFKEVADHYNEAGEISEELYTKLETAGFTKGFVDNFVDSRKQVTQAHYEKATEAIGGLENYRAMQEWAVDNLSEEDKSAINEAVESDNVTKARMGVKYLQELYSASEGSTPNLVQGGAPGATKGYQSEEEFAVAIQNPKWQIDSEYTAMVMEKLKISTY